MTAGPALIGVMQVVDSLDLGGTETVAVNLANRLPRDRYRPFLCSTRRSGVLLSDLQPDVGFLCLDRRSRLDLGALLQLRSYICRENIRLLHVHSSSLFFGELVALTLPGRLKMIWHDHYGRCEWNDRPAQLYRLASLGLAGVIAVNRRLEQWACRELHVPATRVWYVPNFASPPPAGPARLMTLPGTPGYRVVCLANLRPQKDHFTLIRAIALVRQRHPLAHLLLIGQAIDANDLCYAGELRQTVSELGLQDHVTFLGRVPNAAGLLPNCDIGVLSSRSEGLPLSLLEYGWAGLPAVATAVGQCPEALDNGNAGSLVAPARPEQLAAAIELLLQSAELRREQGRRFQAFVRRTFDAAAIVEQVCRIYELVLSEGMA